MRGKIPPVIKWSGSKAPVAAALARFFPDAKRYIEPFVGSGALLPYRNARTAVAADICEELIELWKAIQKTPDAVSKAYTTRWKRLQKEGHTAYYDIRGKFNTTRDPLDLLFLCRTCVNGLIRFNSRGDFNNSLHHTRPGVDPDRFAVIVHQWSRHIEGIKFQAGDYTKTSPPAKATDFYFLDPPYAGTKGRELDDVDATFTRFTLRDERLRLT